MLNFESKSCPNVCSRSSVTKLDDGDAVEEVGNLGSGNWEGLGGEIHGCGGDNVGESCGADGIGRGSVGVGEVMVVCVGSAGGSCRMGEVCVGDVGGSCRVGKSCGTMHCPFAIVAMVSVKVGSP